MKLQNPSLRKRKGFTLIELIVVIAILAILAAIAIPGFLGTLTRAKNRADIATARVIVSAYQVCVAENKVTLDLDGDPTLVSQLVSNGYLDAPPKWQTLSTSTTVNVTYNGKMIATVTDGTNTWYPAPTTDIS